MALLCTWGPSGVKVKQLSSLWFVLLVFAYIVASGGHHLHLIGNHSVGQVFPIARAGGPTKVLIWAADTTCMVVNKCNRQSTDRRWGFLISDANFEFSRVTSSDDGKLLIICHFANLSSGFAQLQSNQTSYGRWFRWYIFLGIIKAIGFSECLWLLKTAPRTADY